MLLTLRMQWCCDFRGNLRRAKSFSYSYQVLDRRSVSILVSAFNDSHKKRVVDPLGNLYQSSPGCIHSPARLAIVRCYAVTINVRLSICTLDDNLIYLELYCGFGLA